MAALSAIERVAVRFPEAVGLNVTEMVQLPSAARAAGGSGQVVVWAKSAAPVPRIDMVLMVSGPAPEFVRVTDCGAPAVPMS